MIKYGSLPFQEQIDFFRNKDLVPTERWNDLTREMHDTGFMVAGAMKADLLADFKKVIAKAIREGTTLAEFRQDFDAVVAHHGWTGWTGEDTKSGRAWRTRVIYETNLRTSYQAGRWQQVQKVKSTRPYLIYKHSDSVVTPREEHVKWHNLVVLQDDPWVKTHWPPNGFGCKCKMFSLSQRDLEKLGKNGPDTPPDDGTEEWTDPKTGDVVSTPGGIQPYWDYAPGASLPELVKGQLTRKAEALPDDLSGFLLSLINARGTVSQAEKVAMDIGIKTVNYADRLDIANSINEIFDDFATRNLPLPDSVKIDAYQFFLWEQSYRDAIYHSPAIFYVEKATKQSGIAINPDHDFWHSPKQFAKDRFDAGFWSSDSPNHVILHELGHLAHYEFSAKKYFVKDANLTAEQTSIAQKVSDYAVRSKREFVAEVFVLLLSGNVPGKDIMQLYAQFGGYLP